MDGLSRTNKFFSCGMRGSSGSGGNSGPPNDIGPFDGGHCRKVPGSDGKENEIMWCCKETANKGIWVPPVNDCHEAADDCIKGAGLKILVLLGEEWANPMIHAVVAQVATGN